MRIHRQKRDTSEALIVAYLRTCGADVCLTDSPCDALVGFLRHSHLVEFKTGKGKLTQAQKAFQSSWRGSSVVVLRSVDEAAAFIRQCRKDHAEHTIRLVNQLRKGRAA